MSVETGELNRRITLRSPTHGDNRTGQAVVTYTNGSVVWAKVRHLKQYEIARFKQTDFRAELEVTIRINEQIEPDWQITFDGKNYQVESVVPVDDTWTVVMVSKVGA